MTFAVHVGDCRTVLAQMPEASVDTVICDPPYGLAFMGKGWDQQVPGADYWRAALRVAKPGAMLLAFGGTRTWHHLATAIEQAGWEIRDSLMWLYGSGFPKSMDVSKAIDKQRFDRAETEQVVRWMQAARERAGVSRQAIEDRFGTVNIYQGFFTITPGSAPRVPTLEQVPVLLELFGITAEDVPEEIRRLLLELNGRKGQPGADWFKREVVGTAVMRDTTVAAPVSTDAQGLMETPVRRVNLTAPSTEAAKRWNGWGTALKPAWEPIILAMRPLDGTFADNANRHGVAGLAIDAGRIGDAGGTRSVGGPNHRNEVYGAGMGGLAIRHEDGLGRWPANVLLDQQAADLLDQQAGDLQSGTRAAGVRTGLGYHGADGDGGPAIVGSSGGASRFFYVAKAARSERGIGNDHPTVKPVDLMRYLCRLTRTPSGGVVLDPFCGSGSTGVGAMLDGRDFIGVELDPHNAEIARHRIAEADPVGRQVSLFDALAEGTP